MEGTSAVTCWIGIAPLRNLFDTFTEVLEHMSQNLIQIRDRIAELPTDIFWLKDALDVIIARCGHDGTLMAKCGVSDLLDVPHHLLFPDAQTQASIAEMNEIMADCADHDTVRRSKESVRRVTLEQTKVAEAHIEKIDKVLEEAKRVVRTIQILLDE